MSYLRLLKVFIRINILGELAYRVNFFINLFQSLVGLGASLAGFAMIFSFTDSLGGWRPDEILALVGVYVLIGGFIRLAIQPGMEKLIQSVRDGSFDFTLTKTEDAQLIASIGRVEIWELINICLGFGLLLAAILRLGNQVGGLQSMEFIAMLITGAVILYSFFLILATLAFWFVRVENILTIFQSMYSAGRWPMSLYPGWLRYGLMFVIPVAFATSVPVEALTGRLNLVTLAFSFILAVLLFVVARIFWIPGLRHYSGTSA